MKRIWILGLVLAAVLTAIGAPVSGKHYSGWDLPSKLGDASTAFSDTCPAITKDGLSLYFVSGATLPSPRDLYVSQRITVDDSWGPPQKLENNKINTADEERCPYVTPDGRKLIFIRFYTDGTDEFYMSTRHDKNDDQGWGDPVIIPALSIDSPGTDYGVWGFEDKDGKLTLYFASRRIGSQLDIYQTTMDSEGNFTTPVPVKELNTDASDSFPSVRKDGLEIYVVSNRAGTFGGWDIWVSTRNSTSEMWSTPVNLGPAINTAYHELRAALTWDGMNMVFASNRGDGANDFDLYKSQRTKVTGKNK